MEDKDKILKDDVTTEEVVDNTPETVEPAAVVEETPVEVAAESDEHVMTAEEFDAENSVPKTSPAKAPMSKKKKITLITIVAVLAVIVIAVGGILIWMFTGNRSQAIDAANLYVEMNNTYYVGTEGEADLNMSFPGATFSMTANDSATLNSGKLTIKGKAPFKVTVTTSGAVKEINVTVVDGALNVSTYEDFFAAANSTFEVSNPDGILTITKAGKDVVIHNTKLVMTKAAGTINLASDIYGNGCKLIATEVAKATPKGSKPWGNSGDTAIYVYSEEEVLVRDLHVIGKELVEGETLTLAAFNNYGDLFYVRNAGGTAFKTNFKLIHSIVENGHKTIHMINTNATIEGCIIRNASDTTVSIGTYADQASTVTLKNNVIANSLTSAVLMYCFDSGVNESKNNDKTWNTVNIEGFLDIYNWKLTADIKFVPDTEMGVALGKVINTIASSEIDNPKKNKEMKVIYSAKEQYVHFGLMKIATNSYGKNGSTYKGIESVDFTQMSFPVPPIALEFIKEVTVVGYFGNKNGDVKPKDKLGSNKDMYIELINGRK